MLQDVSRVGHDRPSCRPGRRWTLLLAFVACRGRATIDQRAAETDRTPSHAVAKTGSSTPSLQHFAAPDAPTHGSSKSKSPPASDRGPGAERRGGTGAFFQDVVAGVRLGDEVTGQAFVRRYGPGLVLREDPDFPERRYLNAGRAQMLSLVHSPGAFVYQFDEIRVQEAPARARGRTPATDLDAFATATGVRLGMAMEQVVQLLGRPHETRRTSRRVNVLYRCEDPVACPGLRKHNMPNYEASYGFEADRLVEMHVLYPYP